MTTFIPRRINAKASKAGKTYWEIETDCGNATCFDYPIVQDIEKNIGKPISMYDLETNEKGFINLRPARNKPAQSQPQMTPIIATNMPIMGDSFKEARNAKDVSIYTSYAKDLFIELNRDFSTWKKQAFPKEWAEIDISPKETLEIMKTAVELIKQAKVSFERSEIFKSA